MELLIDLFQNPDYQKWIRKNKLRAIWKMEVQHRLIDVIFCIKLTNQNAREWVFDKKTEKFSFKDIIMY